MQMPSIFVELPHLQAANSQRSSRPAHSACGRNLETSKRSSFSTANHLVFSLVFAAVLLINSIAPEPVLGQQKRKFGQPRQPVAQNIQDTAIQNQSDTYRGQLQSGRVSHGEIQQSPMHRTFRQASAGQQSQAVTDQRTMLFFFTNHGCAPCKQVEPAIETLKGEGYPVETIHLNNDPAKAQRYMQEFGVTHTPTVVLISGGKLQGRHKGIDIDAPTLKKWFQLVGVSSGRNLEAPDRSNTAVGTKVVLAGGNQPLYQSNVDRAGSNRPTKDSNWASLDAFAQGGRSVSSNFSTPTMIKGTRRPANAYEQRAMRATVRLRVEDPEGISFATGTVIHNHKGECLVMTCGHVFRDAGGKGVITAEYDFESGAPKTAPGELIYYDAKARDIGLVTIRTNSNIVPVPIADRQASIVRGQDIFSVGCDHGETPTIRRSRIKNKALYDGAVKYDIFGRPVDGRSGGGLFTAAGELVGVCNAAAVEVDEGIYTALDTVYWQIAAVNLDHLFENGSASSSSPPARLASNQNRNSMAGKRGFGTSPRWQEEPVGQSSIELVGTQSGIAQLANNSRSLGKISPRSFGNSRNNMGQNRTAVAWDGRTGNGRTPARNNQSNSGSDKEVIIIVRSKTDPSRAEAITVSDPTPQLLNYLDNMQDGNAKSRQLNMARLRTTNLR
ncbi:MAG: trypsin-like peptidase domain-containing protein [Mariniblastus sp.]